MCVSVYVCVCFFFRQEISNNYNYEEKKINKHIVFLFVAIDVVSDAMLCCLLIVCGIYQNIYQNNN